MCIEAEYTGSNRVLDTRAHMAKKDESNRFGLWFSEEKQGFNSLSQG